MKNIHLIGASTLAIFAAMLIALPFMADMMHGHMLRIAARIAGN